MAKDKNLLKFFSQPAETQSRSSRVVCKLPDDLGRPHPRPWCVQRLASVQATARYRPEGEEDDEDEDEDEDSASGEAGEKPVTALAAFM